jgi:guanine deaminase
MRLRTAVLTPVDPDRAELLPDQVVEVEGTHITSVAPFAGQRVDEDLRPGVLLPGFVDAHLHFPQTHIVGRASGPLLDWLARVTFPEEARYADPAYAAAAAEVFCSALAAAGTTRALVYGPVFASAVEVLFAVGERRGQAFVAGPVLMDVDVPLALQVPVDQAFADLEALVGRWHGRGGHQVAVLPRFALSCSPPALRRAALLADQHGLVVSTHLAENVDECRLVGERFGSADYLAVYEAAGLVRRGAVFAHGVQLSAGEWDRLAAAGAIVAHCPDSNAFLGSGGMPISLALDRGVRLAIGTDVAAGRSFRVPRSLSAAYDNALRCGVTLSAERLLWLGTRGDAVGLTDVGFVRPGARADLCLFDGPADTVEALLAALIFDHDAAPVRRTWVDGRSVR